MNKMYLTKRDALNHLPEDIRLKIINNIKFHRDRVNFSNKQDEEKFITELFSGQIDSLSNGVIDIICSWFSWKHSPEGAAYWEKILTKYNKEFERYDEFN